MIFGMTYWQIAVYFLIYSFGGWCLEVIYHAVKEGKIINRGFLNGPVCPVYGFGMLAVIAMLHFLPHNASNGQYSLFSVFIGGMILTTLIEFIAGWILYHLFHARWWDYSRQPFNIGGYICPLFSVLWGLACVLVVRFLHPLVMHSADAFDGTRYGWWIVLFLYGLYLADFVVTALTAAGLNKELDQLDELKAAMRKPSDRMTEIIGTTSLNAAQKVEESHVQAALARDEMKNRTKKAELAAGEALLNTKEKAEEYRQEKKKEYEERINLLLSHPRHGKARLLRAFPHMKHARHDDLVKELQNRMEKKK